MPSNSTLSATIAYEGSKRARVSDLTVELIPLTVALNGTAITSYTVTVTDYWGQPVTWAAPGSAGSAYGVMVGPGTAHELGAGTYRVWVHYDGDPEDITRQVDGWLEVFGSTTELAAELAAASAYQLRAERGQPGGYPTLDGAGLVPTGQLPAAVAAPDATTGSKGIVQLAGDLAGTATAPTVPGLAGKASTAHTHPEADVTGLTADLAGKAATSHTHAGSDVASGTVAYARLPVGTGLNTVAAGDDSRITAAAPDSGVVHNTGAETVAGVKTFSSPPVVPSGAFPQAAVTSLVSDLSGKAATAHTHAEADVTSLVTDLAGKAATSHTHAEADVTSLVSDLAAKADGAATTTALAGKAATSHTHAAADVASGTLAIARLPVGATSSTVTVGNDPRLDSRRGWPITAGGEWARDRGLFISSATPLTSGALQLTYFVATATETINTLKIWTAGTAAATITLIRYGVYTVAGNGDLTLINSTVNDTALLIAANTGYPKALSSAWSKVAGTLYAVGPLIVATTMPTLHSDSAQSAQVAADIWFVEPRRCATAGGLSDLPSTLANASLGSTRRHAFVEMTP